MRIVSVTIEGFRSYKQPTTISFDDLTVLVGKNDVGKSTILEALDIFFENTKMDSNDVNISSKKLGQNPSISVVFSDLPAEIDLDAGAKTNLEDEYLLNSDGNFEIKKDYSSLTKPKSFIVCSHPSTDKINDLHSLKIKDLQTRASELVKDGSYNAKIKNEIRKAIWSAHSDNLSLKPAQLEITQEGVKDIWSKIQPNLPLFALFSVDRKNDEKDKEIQDPLKFAAEQALSKYQDQLDIIRENVEKEVVEVAKLTIDKLKEMNPEVARELKPQFADNLKWGSLFTPTLSSDEIPMNKRGSGVRRLLLINFFRAEAERKKEEKNIPNVIYAIEEPETSQHPDWQIKLLESLQEIASSGKAQVITTTHSPSIARLIEPSKIRFIHKKDDVNKIDQGSEENFQDIAEALGILPYVGKDIDQVKVILCLEGPHDIKLFNNLSRLFGHDFESDPRVVTICLGGGTLGHWVTQDYLKKLNKTEVHIYDKDEDGKYGDFVNEVNNRNNNDIAFLTEKREMENYFSKDIIKLGFFANDNFEIEVEIDDEIDVTEAVSKERHFKRSPNTVWEEQAKRYKSQSKTFVKRHLNEEVSRLITQDTLRDRGGLDEVEKWFNAINERLQ